MPWISSLVGLARVGNNGSSTKNFDPAWRGYNLCILSSTCRIRLLSTRCICLTEAIWAQLARSLSHQPLLSQWHWQPMLCFAEFDAVIEPRAAGNKKQPGITNYCKISRAYRYIYIYIYIIIMGLHTLHQLNTVSYDPLHDRNDTEWSAAVRQALALLSNKHICESLRMHEENGQEKINMLARV